jgi:hypothetical protein
MDLLEKKGVPFERNVGIYLLGRVSLLAEMNAEIPQGGG